MTKEEAIEILSKERYLYACIDMNDRVEAFDMAIEALKPPEDDSEAKSTIIYCRECIHLGKWDCPFEIDADYVRDWPNSLYCCSMAKRRGCEANKT